MSDQVPGGHSLKTEAELAPTSSQKPPAAQDWQAVLPLVGEKVPAGHGLHWREPVSAWKDPLRTKHACSVESCYDGKGLLHAAARSAHLSHSRQLRVVWLPVSGL